MRAHRAARSCKQHNAVHRAARSCNLYDHLTHTQNAWHPALRNTLLLIVVFVAVEREHGFGLRALLEFLKQSEGRSLLRLHDRIDRVVHICCHGMCISAATGAPRCLRRGITSPHRPSVRPAGATPCPLWSPPHATEAHRVSRPALPGGAASLPCALRGARGATPACAHAGFPRPLSAWRCARPAATRGHNVNKRRRIRTHMCTHALARAPARTLQ